MMPRSLRARLILGLLALAGLGLLIAGGVTYGEQRSFLYERIDQQAKAAASLGFPGGARPDGDDATRGAPPLGGPGDHGGLNRNDPENLPATTYVQIRTASGAVIRQGRPRALSTDIALPAPKLPAKVTPDTHFTVNSTGSSGPRYRAYARRTATGGIVIGAVPLTSVDEPLSRLLLIEALVIGGVLLALALGTWWIVRLGLRPLDRIGATAGAIAAGDLSQRVAPADNDTEIGRLGLSLNAMLHQIEEAFDERTASENRLRQFLADASHELRTPLSSIRGYAELYRMGAAREGEDAEKAMNRIEQEAARMGVLVEDLLALARLNETREIAREPVDVSELARDAADDARAAAQDREITLSVPDEDTVVIGDADQLRQVLSNLTGNALVHTPPGTPVQLSVSRSGDRVRLCVADRGPGLPVADGEELFDRFWRAQPARGRGPAGAGLGLAIVHAIVTAHGGTVDAQTRPEGGAAFTVELPVNA
ncbi:MAG: two-component system, OmpR family, sensor kinase [Solirubrobacteraceae bacterium]|jgi:two-component system OmpR family sensor kinase|nr:two-component system, OmpR family, sensor kinase [Solirubrobacteraceae bacterium]